MTIELQLKNRKNWVLFLLYIGLILTTLIASISELIGIKYISTFITARPLIIISILASLVAVFIFRDDLKSIINQWSETTERKITPNQIFTSNILMGFIFIGTLLRSLNLDAFDLHPDEAIVYFVARNINRTGYAILDSGLFYARGILQEYLISFLIKNSGSSETILRVPSVIAGIIVIIAAYFLGKKLKNNILGILTSLYIAISGWQIIFSRYARMYIFFQLSFVAYIIFFYQGLVEKKVFYNILTVITGIACIFLYEMSPVIFLPFIFLLIYNYRKCLKDPRFWISSTILIFTFIIYKYMSNIGMVQMRGAGTQDLLERSIGGYSGGNLSAYPLSLLQMFPMLTLFLIAGAAIFIIIKKRNLYYKYLGWTFLSSLTLVTITDLIGAKNQPRYIFFLFPIFVTLAIYGLYCISSFIAWLISKTYDVITDITEYTKERSYPLIIAVIQLCIFLMLFFSNDVEIGLTLWNEQKTGTESFGMYDITTTIRHLPDWENAAEYVSKNYSENDVIITTAELSLLPQYYLKDKIIDYWLRTENWEESTFTTQDGRKLDIYQGVDILNTKSALENVIAHNERVWILTNHSIFIEGHNKPEVIKFFRENEDHIEFESGQESKVYLFDRNAEE
ncbi:glycosyltransferase family 39 protein [Candidatus Dojkabacteria bacterium]|nr:glycosyltransferase family 39 protein [Candidatus Dojkabacteria bacterium]